MYITQCAQDTARDAMQIFGNLDIAQAAFIELRVVFKFCCVAALAELPVTLGIITVTLMRF
jgi:hypothetical protein